MRGPFGILLIGGGIILIYGLFTGKITFPGVGLPGLSLPQVGYPLTPVAPGIATGPGIKVLNPDGSCPAGYTKIVASGGQHLCKKMG